MVGRQIIPVSVMSGFWDRTDPCEPTEGDPTEGDPTDDKELLILITIVGTVITLTLIVCIVWFICCKCFGRTCKTTSTESQSVSIGHDNYNAKDDDLDNVVIRGFQQTSEQGRNPWNMATYGLNRGFTPGLDPDIKYAIARPAMFADTPSQFWEEQREPQHRALDARSFPDQYTYTYDGLFRSPVGKSSALALTPTDGGPGSGPSFQADRQLQELVRSDMTRSETIMVGSKLVVFISREVSHLGDTLVLQEMGISLSIPPYAIQAGRTERISLILDWDLGDFPSMRDEETIISPVVHCGPHGLKLNKPTVLSYRHCAYDVGDVSVVASETHLMQNKEWREVCGRDDGNRPYTIFPSEVQVQVSHFTLYTCLAEGKTTVTTKAIKKWMQLAVFGGKMRAKHRYEIRVYLLNNTPCALQFAVQNEAKNHFKMLCPRTEFLFHGDGEDMLATVQHVNEGWSHRLDDRQERVPFLSLWHGKCPHVSFIFKHENDHVRDIDIKLVLHQLGRENIESEKTNLKVLASMRSRALSKRMSEPIGTTNKAVINVFPQGKRGKRIQYDSTSSLSSGSISSSSSEGSDVSSSPSSSSDNTSSTAAMDKNPLSKPNDQSTQQPCTQNMQIYITDDESPLLTSLPSAGTPRTIPHELCMELVPLLDPLSPLGNDWRAIASALELDSLIPLLKNTPSYKPTETLLDEVEHQCKGLEWLASVLIKSRRLDAANTVMKYVNMDSTSCVNNES